MLQVFAMAATVAAPAALAPNGKWVVEYAENMCVLQRRFDTATDDVTVAFRPMPLGDATEFVAIVPDTHKGARWGKMTVTIRTAGTPDPAPKVGSAISALNADGAHRMAAATIEGTRTDLPQATTITLAFDKVPPIPVAPIGIDRAIKALDTCQRDLLRSWKIDPDSDASVATPAEPTTRPETWVGVNDYPGSELRMGGSGMATILWRIDTAGRVEDCRVVTSSGRLALDQASCAAITQRARYRPALDKEGKPIVSYAMRRVMWLAGT